MTSSSALKNQKSHSPTILQRVAKADKTGVRDCIDNYGNLIWALAKKFSASAEEAEDAVCEIFLDVWKYAERFEPAHYSEAGFIILLARRRLMKRSPVSKI